jgi:hypothetical protein
MDLLQVVQERSRKEEGGGYSGWDLVSCYAQQTIALM